MPTTHEFPVTSLRQSDQFKIEQRCNRVPCNFVNWFGQRGVMLDIGLEFQHVIDTVKAVVLIYLVVQSMVSRVVSERLSNLLISRFLPDQIPDPIRSSRGNSDDFGRLIVFRVRDFASAERQN